jgi:Holliday junction resolvasome RuvABC DNA-binding subunit
MFFSPHQTVRLGLLGLAAAQGDERALLRMEQIANAMAEALLAEELADKAKMSTRRKKKKKGSEQVRLETSTDECEALATGRSVSGGVVIEVPPPPIIQKM